MQNNFNGYTINASKCAVANSMLNPSINNFLNQRNATKITNHPRRSWDLVIGAAYYVGDKSGLNEATGEYISTLKQINEENKNDPLWHIH